VKNKDVLKAPEAAFTGYERNNNAALLELLSNEFTFEMSDSLPYGRIYVGGTVTMRARSSMRATPWSCR
jgi:hypothetical protein